MAQEAVLRKLDEALGRLKILERERNEAVARIQSLEREASEMRSLIALVESKVDQMLKGSTVAEPAKGQPGNTSLASKGFEQLMEASSSHHEEHKRRFPHAFTST